MCTAVESDARYKATAKIVIDTFSIQAIWDVQT